MMDNGKPDVLALNQMSLILNYYADHPPPWAKVVPSTVKKKKVSYEDLMIVEEVYLVLSHETEHFRNLWNWADFASIYLNHSDSYVVWIACQCLAIILQLTESEKTNFILKFMDQKSSLSHMVTYNFKLYNLKSRKYLKRYISGRQFTNVEEIFLPSLGPKRRNDQLIIVNSTKKNLRSLALAVSVGRAVCLVGPVGSGKSSLVHHLANITGHTDENLLTVQLCNETDSKMMLGSYHCTNIPGEFVWQPGVLTKAVTEGMWLLLEDVDSASNDLAAILGTLIENRILTVPGFRDRIIPATGFRLFFTQRAIPTTSGYYYKQNTATDLLEKHYIKINVEPLSKNELIEVIEIKFPVLKTISSKIIDVFLLFSAGFHDDVVSKFKSNARLTSTRDLLKWCTRIIKEYNVTSSESALKVVHDAIDIFCCSADNSKTRLELASHIASLIGVVKTKAEFFLTEYKPTIVLDEKHCIVGRVTMSRIGSLLTANDMSNSKFAMTRASSCLLERMACSISMGEPVLLVGETGTGKTSALQLLAKHTGNKLIVLNMNQHSDSADLIGGYKPLEFKIIVKPIRDKFEQLFRAEFNVEHNARFLNHVSSCFNNHTWANLTRIMKYVIERAIKKNTRLNIPSEHWKVLRKELNHFEFHLKKCQSPIAFTFVEGSLIQAVKNGYWILLDEINLASSETLQCLSKLLESDGTVTIYENTDFKPITRHPNFRLLAAMNPATDVGKKDLPSGIRNRFTEFFVDELTDRSDLITLAACYLSDYSFTKLNDISKFYLIAKQAAEDCLIDGTGHKPHYSLRTYCRALSIASSNTCQSEQKSLYESFCLSFLTQLNPFSHKRVENLIAETMFRDTFIQGVINQPIAIPSTRRPYIHVQGYWIEKGYLEPLPTHKYILTNSVKKNLRDLARVVSLSKFPILIQGDTCVGKTSLITFLASASGNRLVRINNHGHTDPQEYIGSYFVQPTTGQLLFKEGILVDAMRKGHWIILDELNLAPTDVLESLNRVLDDNREIYIPETQTLVKAHAGFRVFATQNPPGSYGGRKILSRAFKNRFIELHFGEIPANELETILFKRCEIPMSYAKKLISVMKELQSTRKVSSAFSGKYGLITLRDLFRWGERYRLSQRHDNYDWNQHLVDEGFLVLASRVRKPVEEKIIIQILEKHFKCSISLDALFTLNEKTSLVTRHILEKIQQPPPGFEHIYMSKNIRKMVVLACKAIEFKEPILLVGETGCGKTTVCQMIAAIKTNRLLSVNCHQHTESTDFLGGLRPIRNRDQKKHNELFEWVDGPLVKALTEGNIFLADEISLADDSVLERLNSLLEPERKLLLTEKVINNKEILAHTDFSFFGTMNPGGDYGKKELSPALRNRLTEIWCENCTEDDDLVNLINHSFSLIHHNSLLLSQSMVDFVSWLKKTEYIKNYLKLNISIRDYLIWVKFIEEMMKKLSETDYKKLQALVTFYREGAIMLFIDKKIETDPFYDQAIEFALKNSIIKYHPIDNDSVFANLIEYFPLKCSLEWFGYDGYYISKGDLPDTEVPEFSFNDSITKQNLKKLLRCMQIDDRAILLEGSPGVGKTSLVQAVAKASSHELIRINLSEQTDVSDLFGADLPVDGGEGGSFEWRDGPFLRALKRGNWILLDELNLASQSVLEGLNAVLDHRGELYIPELDKTFIIESKKTRIFASQNPMSEGGARKGLPKSFLNRFLQIHLDKLHSHNIVNIIENIYTPKTVITLHLEQVVGIILSFCNKYNVDMNLRDILRLVDVTITLKSNILDHLPLIFTDRTQNIQNVENDVFDQMQMLLNTKCQKYDFMRVFPSATMFNRIVVPRKCAVKMPVDKSNSTLILASHIHTFNSLAVCVKMNWMPILVGSGSGKTSIIKTLSQLYGCELHILSVNSALDTVEILGGFEQADYNRHLEEYAKRVESILYSKVRDNMLHHSKDYFELLSMWNVYRKITDGRDNKAVITMVSEVDFFKKRTNALIDIANVLKDLDLISSLQILQDRVCSVDNLNSGGKFEWIDSILIKCLNNGSWLLIDNANLCSPAVLDRLNGLLEPNGVLELGEKGIGSDGQIQIIKPHKDFRLFLAMDPKHGSISRAMKNRGVEIFMSPLEEISINDICSLLEVQGITDKIIIHKLLEIHKAMRNLATGMTFSFNHLLRTAYLVSENTKRGTSHLVAIREICIDTYVRYLNGNAKQTAMLEMNRILQLYYGSFNKFWCPNIKTVDILSASNYCYIHQQCQILIQHKHLSKTNLEDLLLCYFGRSSSSDIFTRSHWLCERLTFSETPILNFLYLVPKLEFDMLQFAKKSVDFIDPKDLPFDFRYLPDIYFNNGQPVSKTIPYAENKIHLMLDYTFNKCIDVPFNLSKINKKKIMISNGGILHDYAILSNVFDDLINYFLTDHAINIDENNCMRFKEMIIWYRIIEKKIFDKRNKENEFIIVLVYSYFNVIVGHFIPLMELMIKNKKYACLEKLITLKNQVFKNYLTPKRYTKLIKMYKHWMLIPEHQCCKNHGDKNIEIYRKNNNLITAIKLKNVHALIANETKNQRDSLFKLEYVNCKMISNYEAEDIKTNEFDDKEMNLIPIWELIIERNIFSRMNYSCINEKIQRSNEYDSLIKSLLKFVPTVSPLFYNSLKQNNDFSIEFLMESLKHSLNSVAIENPKLYLEWSPKNVVDLESDDNTVNKEMLYSFEQPLFTTFITNILLKKTESYCTFTPTPIRLIDNNSHNLVCIKSLIWNSNKWNSDLQFENIKSLIKMVELFFSSLLPDDILSLEELYSKKYDEKHHSSFTEKANYHESMIKAIYDTANELCHIKKNLKLYDQKRFSTNTENNNLTKQIQISAGRLWVLSGMVLLEIFKDINPVDSLEKMKINIECTEAEINKLESRLYAEKLFCEVDGISDIFPFKNYYTQRIQFLNKNKKTPGYRPDPPIYNVILGDVTRFSKMYGLDSNTYNIITTNVTDHVALVNEMENWLSSVTNFHNNLNERYAGYPDILSGILLSINEMRYGMRILKNQYKWTIKKDEHLTNEEDLLTLFGEFPRFCPDIIKMTNIDDVLSMGTNDKFRWYKLCLEELNNMFYLSGHSCKSDKYINSISIVLDKFVNNWKCLQEEIENKNREEVSIYKQRSMCETIPLEIELAQGLSQQFPTSKHDFDDIEGPLTLDMDVSQNSIIHEVYHLTDKDINDICRLHTELIRPAASAFWLSEPLMKFDQSIAVIRLKNSFADRFCLFGKQLMSKFMYLDSSMDGQMIPWLLMATDIASNPQKIDNKGYYDFYRDSNVEFAKKTFEVITKVEEQIQKLILEWPEHPTLQTILQVVERIMDFNWDSPACRFLIGLELLLTKLHEWEMVAHQGVSVHDISLTITQCIQEYRNLELSTWKDCLKSSLMKIQNNSSKWWFHLYSIFQTYIHDQESFPQLVIAIQKFMESSSLGEFIARLELLYTFHCDVVCKERSAKQVELCNASWNLYKYYSQFQDSINQQIETESAEIKTKLQGFIKIVKWNDINYWTIKETVNKVQQTLHKYTREYQEILSKPASLAMYTTSAILNSKTDRYTPPIFKLNNYLEKCEIILNINPSKPVNVLSNINKYSKKLFTLSEKIITNCSYPTHITELNDFINSIMESANELRDLTVDTEMSKVKQKSQAKNILQQKRKALSELFKALQNIGLSYKAGLIGSEEINCSVEFAILPPIDINAALQSLTPKLVDDDLRCAWTDCEVYFLKSVSQTTALKLACETPKLGSQEMDRIKGFINDLKNVTWNTKQILALNINSLIKFRSMIYLSDQITSSKNVIFNPSDDFQQPANYLINGINILQQFKVAVQCCNENIDSKSTDSITTLFNLPSCDYPSAKKSKKTANEILIDIDNTINLTQNSLNSLMDKKTYRAMKLSNVNFMIKEKYNTAVDMCNQLTEYIIQFYKSIWINDYNTLNKHTFKRKVFVSENTEQPLEEINSFITQVLKSIEKLYKKQVDIKSKNKEDKLLKYLIIQSLSSDLEDFDLTSITNQFENVLKLSIGDDLLKLCRPLFEQYILLAQYFITQQTMVYRVLVKMNYLLSTLFTDLASNGFCIPDELLEGEESTQTDGKNGGLGLDDGEGKKDVSNEIESQDQLEDAKQNYNDQQEVEKDLKEEENGVEMSDDFDGKLHDMEQDGRDNEDNDDEDCDKEMGETSEGADTLDEKLWGNDSEDENVDEQENQDLKEDNDGQEGEDFGDKSLGPKSEMHSADAEEHNDEPDNQKQNNHEKDINELDENGEQIGEDHVDPFHGDMQPPPESEPMDLSNDLQLDEGEMNDNDEKDGEDNPFDIDAMKENVENIENDDGVEFEEPKENINNIDFSDEENNEEMKDDDNDNLEGNKLDKIDDDSNKPDDEPKENDTKINLEEANPSDDKPSKVETQPSNLDNGGSKDQVCKNADGQDTNEEIESNKEEATGPETQGVGQSQRESNDTKEGHSIDENIGNPSEESGTKNKRRLKPGEKDMDRTLAQNIGPMKKRLKTTDIIQDENKDEENLNNVNDNNDLNKGELFKHIKESKDGDAETLDAATNEQLEKVPIPNNENEVGEELKEDDEMEIDEISNENKTNELGEEILPEKIKPKIQNNQSMKDSDCLTKEDNLIEKHTVDGEVVLTHTAERGMDTMFHSMDTTDDNDEIPINNKDFKTFIKNQFNKWVENQNGDGLQNNEEWNKFMNSTTSLSQELSEQLRLVLEPTKASRLQGNFRTGRRINMRRVIPYIASQFKKDKIWLRRTKPSKRQYQIIMAVDNSSSMIDSMANDLTFKSLALVSKALTLVEAGELGVMSFGEKARIIHPLGEPFSDQTGAKLIHEFTFDEDNTKVGELVELATAVFEDRGRLSDSDKPAQLLVIMSDGRRIKCEGPDILSNAIRLAKINGIFIVFIIIDNPSTKASIMDMKIPIFENNCVRIESYMDHFPFPFYVVLRDVEKLPGVLSDALREWFELVTTA